MKPFAELDSATFVSPQITLDIFAYLQKQGFSCVVCHRPDGEEPGQPRSDALRQAAESAGLTFHHLPVSELPDPQVAAETGRILASLPEGKRALMFCRSGMRSTAAWAMARRMQGETAASLRERAAQAGYDISRVPL